MLRSRTNISAPADAMPALPQRSASAVFPPSFPSSEASQRIIAEVQKAPYLRELEALNPHIVEGRLRQCGYLESLRRAFARAGINTSSVSTVLYPAAGFDIVAPAIIFPKAKLIIGIDNHPFLPAAYLNRRDPFAKLEARESLICSWVLGSGHNGKIMAEYLCANLVASERGLIRRIAAIRGNKSSAMKQREEVHGFIEFVDQGTGDLRTYVHIDATIPTRHAWMSADIPLSDQWWPEALGRLGFNGVLLKGSNDAFAGRNLVPETERFFVQALREVRGVLLQGFSQEDRTALEFSNLDALTPLKHKIVNRPGIGYHPRAFGCSW